MGIKMVGKEKDPPVTVMMSRRPLPGKEKAFEEYLAGVTGAARLRSGHLGATIFRPVRPEDRDYHILFKFDRRSNLERWETSAERAQFGSLVFAAFPGHQFTASNLQDGDGCLVGNFSFDHVHTAVVRRPFAGAATGVSHLYHNRNNGTPDDFPGHAPIYPAL